MTDSNQTDSKDEDGKQVDYTDMVPKEIELAVERLGRGDVELKFAVLMVLVESESRMSESDIEAKLNTDINHLDSLLDDLQCGGLVARYAGERIGDPSTGEYDITTYGKRILGGLHAAIQPKFTTMVSESDR